MSHAKNKVDWCLKKAEKELEQGQHLHIKAITDDFSI